MEHMKKVVEVEVTFEEERVRFESFEGGGKGFIGSSKARLVKKIGICVVEQRFTSLTMFASKRLQHRRF